MEIKLPFRPYFSKPMRDGQKVMTCRPKPMGTPGDTFHAFGCIFTLTHVMRMRLGYVGSDCFEQEGCKSVQEFVDIWKSIHPTKGFDPEEIVWAHCFKRTGTYIE